MSNLSLKYFLLSRSQEISIIIPKSSSPHGKQDLFFSTPSNVPMLHAARHRMSWGRHYTTRYSQCRWHANGLLMPDWNSKGKGHQLKNPPFFLMLLMVAYSIPCFCLFENHEFLFKNTF